MCRWHNLKFRKLQRIHTPKNCANNRVKMLQDTSATQKLALYTLAMNNFKSKLKKQFHVPFAVTSKMLKYLGINLTKKV